MSSGSCSLQEQNVAQVIFSHKKKFNLESPDGSFFCWSDQKKEKGLKFLEKWGL